MNSGLCYQIRILLLQGRSRCRGGHTNADDTGSHGSVPEGRDEPLPLQRRHQNSISVHDNGHHELRAQKGKNCQQKIQSLQQLPGGKVAIRNTNILDLRTIETDRNPNFDYRQKPNILLNPKYSSNCRIAEYRIVPTISANLKLFCFGRIFG